MMLKHLFNRGWWPTTLLVVAAVAVMVRLGFWQLDRLAQRRAFNARVSAQISRPTLVLAGDALPADLTGMEYRSVVVVGEYDHEQQVALRNQAWENRPGVHLLTPLIIAGSHQAVLVDRGWIPLADAGSDRWNSFDEHGRVEVRGIIRMSQARPDFGGVPDPAGRLTAWNVVNVTRIAEQVSLRLLPVYIQQAPDAAWTGLPRRSQPVLDLSDGPHLGYAVQWFLFAAVLGIGYPVYVRDAQRRRPRLGRAKLAAS